jgi:hypothetical protein
VEGRTCEWFKVIILVAKWDYRASILRAAMPFGEHASLYGEKWECGGLNLISGKLAPE